ncbi:MAG: hypothetical protein U0175_29670 [Caldilineaceae bacterium]
MRNATRIIASTFGLLAGLAGLEHGIGETLQGNRAPTGIMIESWPTSTSMRVLGGEPAMTLIPNLLVSGLLTILVSLILLLWVAKFVKWRPSGLILLLLSVSLLLVGGGFGPPVLGFIAAAVATRINVSHRWWRSHLSAPTQRRLTNVWPWSFALCLGAWLLLFPGTLIIGYYLPLLIPSLLYMLILLAFGSLLVTIGVGFVHDSYGQAVS